MTDAQRQRGFTLMELIIYLGIASIALLVFYGFAADVMRSAVRAKAASDVQENARVVMSRITGDVRNATAVPSAAGGQLSVTIGGAQRCYFLDSGKVKYDDDCISHASPEDLTDDSVSITALSFDASLAPQIGIGITVEPHIATSADPVTLSTTIVPRSSLY